MKINLNLATRPYVELRPVYSRLRVIAAVLAVLALPMLLFVRTEESKAQQSQARVRQLQDNIARLQGQQARDRALAEQGPNAAILRQADYLNSQFRRKSFSWTATMSDLETTLPPGVEVHAIAPVVSPNGHVLIRMRVVGARDKAIEVVRNLEHSRHFIAPRLTGEARVSESNGAGTRNVSLNTGGGEDVQFDILADYRPLPISPSHESGQQARPQHARSGRARHTRGRRAYKPAPGTAVPTGGR